MPGYDIQVLNDEGQPCEPGTTGNIVVKLPLPPSCFPTLWNDDERFQKSYLSQFPGYYFTGDINATGTKVTEPGNGKDGYQDDIASNIMFHRWKGGSAPTRHANKINTDNDEVSFNSSQGITSDDFENGVDVVLSLPADSTVRVQSGNQIEIPLTITNVNKPAMTSSNIIPHPPGKSCIRLINNGLTISKIRKSPKPPSAHPHHNL